jgi:hypothetical protein
VKKQRLKGVWFLYGMGLRSTPWVIILSTVGSCTPSVLVSVRGKSGWKAAPGGSSGFFGTSTYVRVGASSPSWSAITQRPGAEVCAKRNRLTFSAPVPTPLWRTYLGAPLRSIPSKWYTPSTCHRSTPALRTKGKPHVTERMSGLEQRRKGPLSASPFSPPIIHKNVHEAIQVPAKETPEHLHARSSALPCIEPPRRACGLNVMLNFSLHGHTGIHLVAV